MQILFGIISFAVLSICSVQGKSLFSVEELTEEPVFKGLDGVYQSSWQRYNTGRIGLKIQKNVEMIDSKAAVEMIFAACKSSDNAATCTDIISRFKADYQTMVSSVGALFKLLDPYLEQVELEGEKKNKNKKKKNRLNSGKPSAEKAVQKDTTFQIQP